MKPKIIGDFTDFADQKPQAPEVRLTLSAGEVEAMACTADEWDFPLLISAVRAAAHAASRAADIAEKARALGSNVYSVATSPDAWHQFNPCGLLERLIAVN